MQYVSFTVGNAAVDRETEMRHAERVSRSRKRARALYTCCCDARVKLRVTVFPLTAFTRAAERVSTDVVVFLPPPFLMPRVLSVG